MFVHRRPHWFNRFGIFLALLFSQVPGVAKLIPRRDPIDGALDATVIVIMRQETQDTFKVEEVFLGDVQQGQTLALPGFKLVVEDTSTFISGIDRIEPIYPNTRILIFLKPAGNALRGSQLLGDLAIAGFGNCYFWSHDPTNLDSLRSMAKNALALRTSWEAALHLPDKQQRVEALWPYLWNHNGCCYNQTQTALQEVGTVAGDYIAGQLENMSYRQKNGFLIHSGSYDSSRLHIELIRELKKQQAAWEVLLNHHKTFAKYDDIARPGRNHYYPRRPQDAETDEAVDIYGVLYYGFTGLGSFHDRSDLPFIRESALWGVRYRFKQLDDAALGAFGEMPERANLPVIEAIWREYSSKPFVGNELRPFDVMQALSKHRFPEAIPLMAQFVNAGFAQEMARQFLVDMTGIDLGGDTKRWLDWYEAHKGRLGVRM